MSSLPPLPAPWVFDTNRNPPAYTRLMVGSELAVRRYWNTFDASGDVCIGIDFTSPLGTEELGNHVREALDKLRFVCPIIACTIEDGATPRWVYTPSADRKAWLDLAFAVEDRGASLNSSDFIQRVNLKRLPYTDGNDTIVLLRAYLLTTSKDGNNGTEYGLYFHGAHVIIDAGPALHALNLMCEWISGKGMDVRIEQLEEWKNLPVDPITATGGPSKEWDTAGTRLLQELADQTARTSPPHSMPSPTCPASKSDPLFHHVITFSESETAAIIPEAKKLGLSVTTLIHAAHCLAMVKINPVPEATEVDFPSMFGVVSLERYMKPLVNPRTHFISCMTLMPLRFSITHILMEHDEKERLTMLARMLQERYDRYITDPCLPHLYAAMEIVMPTGAGMVTDGMTEEAKEALMSWWHSGGFTSLGVVEKKLRTQHGKIKIKNICLGTRMRNFLGVHMWTMHSKIHLQVQGATVWGEERMKMLLEEMRRIASLVLDRA